MSQLSKNQLKAENQTQFPNNNVGAITPSHLRAFNVDFIDSTVNQTDFTSFSGSVASEIDALEAFSQSLTTNFVSSASFATFSQSVESQFNTIEAEITALENFSTSLDTNFVNQNELAAATGSLLETASLSGGTLTFTKGDSSTFGINLPTASITASYGSFAFNGNFAVNNGAAVLIPFNTTLYSSLISISGSSGIEVTEPGIYDFDLTLNMSGSISNARPFGLWVRKNNQDVSGSLSFKNVTATANVYAGASSTWQLQADAGDVFQFYVMSIIPSATSGSAFSLQADFTSSVTMVWNTLSESTPNSYAALLNANRVDVGGLSSGSYTNIQALNQYTASNDQKWNTLGSQTGSFITEAETGSMTVLSASFATTAAFALNANFDTASFVGTASFNAYTQSTDSRLSNIESATASFVTESETGSFARTDASNTFTQNNSFLQNVTISGNLYVSGSEVIVSSSTLIVGDRIIEVNANRVIGDAGIYAFDALTDQTGSMIWDPYVDYWKAGLSGSETRVITAADTASMLSSYITTAVTGAFATTGSNTFRGDETFEDAGGNASTLVPTSGSLMLVAKTYTSASSHISTSAGNFINLIFKNNNNTGTTVISGSNNIFTNPSAPTAGFRREMTSDNWVNGTTAITQLSASMAYPITNSNNIFLNPTTHQMRGPVSSSAWTYQNNIIHGNVTLGTTAAPIVNMVAGATISGNLNFGTLQFGGHPTNLLKTSVTYSRNFTLGTGAVLFAFNSGSMAISNNTIVGAANTTISNNSFSGSAGTGVATNFNDNIIHGNSNTITYSGQRTTGYTPIIGGNALIGGYNDLHLDTTSGKILYQAILLGNELSVSGSNIISDPIDEFGTVFVGRYNVNDGVRNTSRENIFVVGTGNANGTKNGLLIDSGSNMFVEGTFNMSGSSNFNGNVIITGSLTASLATGFTYVGNASGITEAVATSSIVVATASFATNATDIVVSVKNTTGVQINKGTVVRIIGATGDNPLIGTASWEDDNNSANTLGFVVNDIANDAFGRVMTQGTLLAVNTDPALGYAAGDLVYLSSSGQYTNVKPPAPYHEVRLGQVLRAQQNNGSIYVLIQNGYEIAELHDVDINTGSLANNDLLAYDSASAQWVNRTVTGVGALTTSSFNAISGTFATTGSNVFTGSQTINGGQLRITNGLAAVINGEVFISSSFGTPRLTVSGSGNQIIIENDSIELLSSTGPIRTNIIPAYIANYRPNTFDEIGLTSDPTNVNAGISGWTIGPALYTNDPSDAYPAMIGFQNKANWTDGRITALKSFIVSGSLDVTNTFTASLAQGFTYVGGASGRTIAVATSSFASLIDTGSFVTTSSFNAYTASTDSRLTNIETATASLFTSASLALVTASVAGNVLTFTKGDATTFQLTVATGSGGSSFPYTGDAVISGSLQVTGSMRGNVGALTVASSTASINMNDGNFFTLTLPTGSTTRIEFTNIKAGQTINLQVTQGATSTGSVAFPSTVLFAGGYDYTPTAITGAVDLLSFVTFNTTSVVATAVKNLL